MFSLILGLALAQPAEPPATWPEGIRSEMVETGTVDLQVYRAGDEGMPVVVMQDMHDYFAAPKHWTDAEAMAGWIERGAAHRGFVARLGEQYRVYAPIRPGYGETTDTGVGYGVAAHVESVLAMLDAEGIEKAVFVGRTPSQNDMLWLAEHHPERMAGMILLEGTPQPLLDVSDPDLFAFASGWWRGADDIGASAEAIDRKTIGRLNGYIPHFLTDPEARIDVPTLYLLTMPAFEDNWMWANLYGMEKQFSECPEMTEAYPCSIFGDAERVARLDAIFADHPMDRLVSGAREAMARQFTDITFDPYPHGEEFAPDMWGDYHDRIQPFLARLSEGYSED